MKKKTPKVVGGGLSATEIAQLSNVSLSRVYAELAQGRSTFEILMTAQRRRQAATRDQQLANLPVTPLNGHGAQTGLVSFSEAARRKEVALATIREHEAGVKTGELVPAQEARQWLAHVFVPLVAGMRAIPQEMADLLPPGTAELLSRRIEGCIQSADRYLVAINERAGKPLTDGVLDVGEGWRVRWLIEAPPVPRKNSEVV